MNNSLASLSNMITKCHLCPRLVAFRESVKKKSAYQKEIYWRKPVAGFGDTKARLLIIGLAPSAHGANRTGRIFTGDESARFLMKCLYQTGFANQPTSLNRDDHLILKDCYLTATVKCVPPQNQPLQKEWENCMPYLKKELHLLPKIKVILLLGHLAFKHFLFFLRSEAISLPKIDFHHGQILPLQSLTLVTSYHPSPQNTYTGKLTEKMFINLLNNIKTLLQ